jgi:cobalt-zinc-cadmium efflux system protein
MLSDFAALALAWFAVRLARRPADWKRTYGFDRFSILVAFTNGIALFAIAIWIVAEAIQRLATPQPVLGGWMMAVAVAGLVINVFAFWILQGGSQSNLNVRAAVLHVAGDLLGSVAAIAAAGVIISTGWTPIDPLLSVLVSLLILRFAWRVVAESGHILLEGAPPGLDTRQIAEDLSENVAGVADVHHVHLWSITEARPMITLHARISRDHAAEATVAAIKTRLREKFGLGHATVEIERDACADAAGSDSAC